MADPSYRNFMIDVFFELHPLQFVADQVIISELEEVDEMVFITRGSFKIGYKLNYKSYFKLQGGPGSSIGGFELAFDR